MTTITHNAPETERALAAIVRKLALIVGVEAERRLRVALMQHGPRTAPQVAFRAARIHADRTRRDADRYVSELRRHLAAD